MTKRPKPIVLTVLDGWGYRAETKGNAIALARKPTYDESDEEISQHADPYLGTVCRLPEGQMGNSEVGHMNMGAGRIVHMDITRIDLLIANNQLQNVPLFRRRWSADARSNCILSDCSAMVACTRTFNICLRCWKWPSRIKWKTSSCTASWTGATRRRTAARDYVRQLQQKMRELQLGPDRAHWWDATTRWTATTAGSASSWPIVAMVHGVAETRIGRSYRGAAAQLRART